MYIRPGLTCLPVDFTLKWQTKKMNLLSNQSYFNTTRIKYTDKSVLFVIQRKLQKWP